MTAADRSDDDVARGRLHAVTVLPTRRDRSEPSPGPGPGPAPRARPAAAGWLPRRPLPVDAGTPDGPAGRSARALADADRTSRVVGGSTAPDRGGPPDGAEPLDPEVAAVAARGGPEALATAAAWYTAAYGHPLDHPAGPGAGGRRWWLSTRHAVVAGVAVVVLTTGVVLRATGDVPAGPVDLPASVAAEVAPSRGPAPAGGGDGAPGAAAPAATAAAAGGAAPSVPAAVAPGAAPAGTAAPGAAPVVHVVGQVAAPGVLTLPAGSRVRDAVAAAGGAGPQADLAALNLARPVVDGEQIHVPAHGETPSPAPAGPVPGGSAGGAGAPAGPVPLNTADLAALDALPGIGPVLAQRIVDWRVENGPLRSVEELREVSGIGDALMARLRPLVTV